LRKKKSAGGQALIDSTREKNFLENKAKWHVDTRYTTLFSFSRAPERLIGMNLQSANEHHALHNNTCCPTDSFFNLAPLATKT
jgi:hypothetical protein